MKNKLKILSLFSALILFSSCVKDFYEDVKHQEQIKDFKVNSLSLDEFKQKFNSIDKQINVDNLFVNSNNNSNVFRANNNVEILSNEIREINQDSYTSYTMLLSTADTIANNFYNLTIEITNQNISGAFITKYQATNNWINNNQEAFQGTIIKHKLMGDINTTAKIAIKLTEAFESDPDSSFGGGFNLGSGGGSTYPINCNGVVETIIIIEPYKCGCGHWPWQTCNGCDTSPNIPGYHTRYEYECIPDNSNPNNTNPNSGNNNNNSGTSGNGSANSSSSNDTSIAAMIKPIECTQQITGDLNGDCTLDDNEQQYLIFYNNLTKPQQQIADVNESVFFSYLVENNYSEESEQIVEELIDYLFENNDEEEAKNEVNNLINLLTGLKSNPNLLLEIPCSQIPNWQTISQHQVPQSIKNKVLAIKAQNGWFASGSIQNIDDSNNGSLVNMDFFPITITQMPKKPNGIAYTQKELFNYIRLNINDFFDDLIFTPVVDSDYNINETSLWNSSNPLGAILSININPDEGSVVCSNYNSTTGEWYFSTITVPWDGSHPVSGHRTFGYYTDVNGNMVIYTRGVDRFTMGSHMLGNTGATLEIIAQNIAFSAADAKWSNFQQKLTNFVNQGQSNSQNGSAVTNTPVKYRPNWNHIKNVLNGTQPISSLGCN